MHIITLNFHLCYKKHFYKFEKNVNYQIWNIIKYTKCVGINEGNMFGSLMKLSRETGPIPDNLIKSFTASSNKLAALWRRFVFNFPFDFSCDVFALVQHLQKNAFILSDEC